jgi:hypothetical protein
MLVVCIQEQENGEMEPKGAVVHGLPTRAMLEQRLGNWSKARELSERAANVQPRNQTRALLEARAHNYAAARSPAFLCCNMAAHQNL